MPPFVFLRGATLSLPVVAVSGHDTSKKPVIEISYLLSFIAASTHAAITPQSPEGTALHDSFGLPPLHDGIQPELSLFWKGRSLPDFDRTTFGTT